MNALNTKYILYQAIYHLFYLKNSLSM